MNFHKSLFEWRGAVKNISSKYIYLDFPNINIYPKNCCILYFFLSSNGNFVIYFNNKIKVSLKKIQSVNILYPGYLHTKLERITKCFSKTESSRQLQLMINVCCNHLCLPMSIVINIKSSSDVKHILSCLTFCASMKRVMSICCMIIHPSLVLDPTCVCKCDEFQFSLLFV